MPSPDPAPPVDHALERRVLARYAEELAGLPVEEAAAWLLRRLAAVEAMQVTARAGTRPREWADPGPAAVLVLEPIEPVPEAPLPTEVAVSCDDALAQEGFHDAETAEGGRSFRWIGPEPRATVFLPKVALPAEVRLHVHAAFCPEVLGDISVSIDEGPWEAALQEEGGARVLVARPRPGERPPAGATRLDIDAVRTASPLSRGAADARLLGLALWRIEARSLG
ncbi:hypothetical protein EAH89_07515 [Roseomonas nepalensis]|uniref:Uncharacterized protein n=1 Tax=Muricoccus nepalensis TaxID=1854500 RepID=A0A502GBS8_9PROT|nr:hypothetical protein [Roseomonas nepalensis]TPG59181.1 hypothetical protein EAH89_07515 [Roseomonas nepalensis]